jgi:hypothetical protein
MSTRPGTWEEGEVHGEVSCAVVSPRPASFFSLPAAHPSWCARACWCACMQAPSPNHLSFSGQRTKKHHHKEEQIHRGPG